MTRRATSKATASVPVVAANVVAAKFEHMKVGLVDDYRKAEVLMIAILQLDGLAHNRWVEHLREQGRLGEQSTTQWMEKYMQFTFSSLSLWQLPTKSASP